MVNIKNANVTYSAHAAFSAKISNQRKLSLPVPLSFVKFMSVDIPKRLAAHIATKASVARDSALLAISAFFPSRRKVALLTAILSCPLAKPI